MNSIRSLSLLQYLLLLVGGTCSTMFVYAQPDSIWKSNHDMVNRYEGLYSQPVAGTELEILSFYSHFENYHAEANSKDELFIRFYLPEKKPVTIKVFEKEPEKYYWMEPKPFSTKSGWNLWD